ncbi:hypothetical protein AAFF_G00083240 [Aldrovandia affinis]|uniref:Uncharacterized protein n=1 Tax=Aldrovandia affinis TaxID=143900 RepID=A0AAD7RXC4_9TELE|nr:hypothetical protein AAFF_G00083240 [Aldrovandia affinis]
MATNFTVSVDEVSCPVCRDVFNNPVILPCSHSLCKGCLQKCWRAGFQKCPLCKRVCPAGTNPPINLALKNLCERFFLEQEAGGSSETLCSLHREKLKLFCLVDKQPICADCVPHLHDSHKCCHLNVAVHDHKTKIQAALKPLQKKMEAFCEIRATGDQKVKQIKSQAQHTEEEIKKKFQELHRFLYQEETDRVTALRVEEAKRSQILSMKMEKTAREMEALSTTITTIEQEMDKEDILFLQNYNDTMKRAQCTVKDPDVSGVLINVAKHLGNLQFQVWEKMLSMVQYTPVILDPNTACSALILSEDLTSVQNIKDHMDIGHGCYSLLGSRGFSSGKHQWDVEVNKDAIVDIAPEPLTIMPARVKVMVQKNVQ